MVTPCRLCVYPLDLRYLPFARTKSRWVRMAHGGMKLLSGVPYGMPQLAEYKWISDTVCSLYQTAEQAIQGDNPGVRGSLWAYRPSAGVLVTSTTRTL